MKTNKKPYSEHTPVHTTFPLANESEMEKETNEAIPSEDDVKEARDWVNYNEK